MIALVLGCRMVSHLVRELPRVRLRDWPAFVRINRAQFRTGRARVERRIRRFALVRHPERFGIDVGRN